MKTANQGKRSGFTLMELMVAMAITTIIVTVLVSITSIALDTWNRSRSELRAARQAKAMVDSMARDFEALVTRRGNQFEWLSAFVSPTLPGRNLKSTNASKLIFFSGSTDRYNGRIGTDDDEGGDVSCVAYLLDFKEAIASTGSERFETFVLNRLLVNPDETFENLLGKEDLKAAFETSYDSDLEDPKNFVCENVYQFSVTFHVEFTDTSATPSFNRTVPITLGKGSDFVESFRVFGTGIEVDGETELDEEELKSARLKAMEVSITVFSDALIDQMRVREPNEKDIAKNSFEYSKLIQLPSM